MAAVIRFTKEWMILRGIMAGLVMFAAILAALWTLFLFRPPPYYVQSADSFIAFAALGGLVAGWLVGGQLGRSGWRGLLRTLLGFTAATFIGAFLAGLLILGPANLDMLAIWAVFHFVTPAGLMWLAVCAALHFAAKGVRRII